MRMGIPTLGLQSKFTLVPSQGLIRGLIFVVATVVFSVCFSGGVVPFAEFFFLCACAYVHTQLK